MARFPLALVMLALPALSGAEEIFRWRAADGTLHYSNQPAHVPSDAVGLRTGQDPLEAARATVDPPPSPGPELAPRRGRQEV